MKTLSVFIGLARSSLSKAIYSLSLYYNGEVLTLPSKLISSVQKVSEEYIILTAIYDLMQNLKDSKLTSLTVEFYANNDNIYERFDIYNKHNQFVNCPNNELSLFKNIIKEANQADIKIIIKAKNNNLAKISEMNNQKMKKELKKV